MKLSTYILLLAIAVVQWVITIVVSQPTFDPTTFLAGNIQMIGALALWQYLSPMLRD